MLGFTEMKDKAVNHDFLTLGFTEMMDKLVNHDLWMLAFTEAITIDQGPENILCLRRSGKSNETVVTDVASAM